MTFDLLRCPDYIDRVALIYFVAKLVNIPVDPQQTIVDNANVRTNTLNFLCIP